MEKILTTKHTSMQDKIVKFCFKAAGVNKPFKSEAVAVLFFKKRQKANRQPITLPKIKSKQTVDVSSQFPVYTFTADNLSDTAVIYLHGGAYVYQPLLFHWKMLDNLSQTTALPIIAPIYPKAPEYHFNTAYEYLERVYRQALERYKHVILMGDSAGGGLALGFTQYCQQIGLAQPDKLILISPWVDITLTNKEIQAYKKTDVFLSVSKLHLMGKKWAGEADLADYRVSPLYGSLKNLPPIALFVGGHEILLPDIRILKDKLLKAQNMLRYYEKEKMPHVYPILPFPEAKEIQNIIVEELKSIRQ